MITNKSYPWTRICVMRSGEYVDGFYSGGLDQEGAKYLVSDDACFYVWDIDQQATVLTDDDLELDNGEFIGEWNARQRITFPIGAARGTYDYSDPTCASRNRCNGIVLRVNDPARGCEIVDEAEDRVLQTLKCDPMSDWASPSISRNGRTIAILEPYEVSFYRQIRPAGDARNE